MQESGNGEGTPTKSTKRREFLKKMSKEYEDRGLSIVNIDNKQVAALHTENNRERTMNKQAQNDINMLRAQLAKAEEHRLKQEKSLEKANAEIRKQQEHINQ